MNIGIIFAGGVGSRMNSKIKPKQFLLMHGKPIIVHTIDVFNDCEDIDAIVIACLEEWIPYMEELAEKYNLNKVKKIVPGGKTAQDSTFNALCAAREFAKSDKDIVLIHDGVRPMITKKLLEENIRSVKEFGSAITCVEAKETVIAVDNEEKITDVPLRKNIRLARAPQSFFLKDILEAHENARKEHKIDFIDSCTMMKYYGYDLHLIIGPSENIKVTTPDDFYTLRALLDARENSQVYGLENEG